MLYVDEVEVSRPDDLANELENPRPGFHLHSWGFVPGDGQPIGSQLELRRATNFRVWIVWTNVVSRGITDEQRFTR